MDQHVYGQSACSHGGGDGIDQERHVLIDDGDAHEAAIFRFGAQQNARLAVLASAGGLNNECCGGVQMGAFQGAFAGQHGIADPILQHGCKAAFFLGEFLESRGLAACFCHALRVSSRVRLQSRCRDSLFQR